MVSYEDWLNREKGINWIIDERTRSSNCISLARTFRPWARSKPKHLKNIGWTWREKVLFSYRSMINGEPRICWRVTLTFFSRLWRRLNTFLSGLFQSKNTWRKIILSMEFVPWNRDEIDISFTIGSFFFDIEITTEFNGSIEWRWIIRGILLLHMNNTCTKCLTKEWTWTARISWRRYDWWNSIATKCIGKTD